MARQVQSHGSFPCTIRRAFSINSFHFLLFHILQRFIGAGILPITLERKMLSRPRGSDFIRGLPHCQTSRLPYHELPPLHNLGPLTRHRPDPPRLRRIWRHKYSTVRGPQLSSIGWWCGADRSDRSLCSFIVSLFLASPRKSADVCDTTAKSWSRVVPFVIDGRAGRDGCRWGRS